MSLLHLAGWVIGITYATIPSLWLIVHPRSRRIGRVRTPIPILGLIWLVLGLLAAAVTAAWRTVCLYSSPWSWLLAAPFFAAGFLLYILATRRFTTSQLLGRPELHPHTHEQRLVTGGIRQYIRHPIYVGHFLELLGWSLGTGMLVLYGLTAFAIITGLIMVRAEDKELEQRFGSEYAAYRRRVPALIPRFW